jgi:DNA primase
VAGRIPQGFIDDLLARTDIVEVIDHYVPLKKGGRDFKACCPFHDEKTPSFTVSPSKQFYHCFGCGAHGTAIGFLMDYARLDFVDAVEELAVRHGLEVPREGGAPGEPRDALEPIFELLAAAATWYRRQLREHPQAGRAVDYLKGRGVSGEAAAEFGLGYAPPGWDALTRALGGDPARDERLVLAGISGRGERGGCYDLLRDRIVFPILDRRGRTVGFGGRALGDSGPKYINSPETPVFHKGRELYGLFQARRNPGALTRLLVVEGYLDVVTLAQRGIPGAVATLGTAATAEQLEAMFRAAPDIVFCFDGDDAGRRAARRALETALPLMRDGRQARFLFLPEGEDPDSLVRRRGAEEFLGRLEGAVSLGTLLFDQLLAEVDLGTIDGRARLVELARPQLARLPPGAFRRLAFGRLAELSGIDAEDWTTLPPGRRVTNAGGPGRTSPRRGPSLVRRAVTLLLHHPQLAGVVDDLRGLAESQRPGVPLLVEMVRLLRLHPDLRTGAVLERYRDHPDGRHLGRLAGEEVPELSPELEREFADAVVKLARHSEEERFRELAHRGRDGTLTEEERAEFVRLSTGRTPVGLGPEDG